MTRTSPNRLILLVIIGAILGVWIGKPVYEITTGSLDMNPLVMLGLGILFAGLAFTYLAGASKILTLPILGGLAIVLIVLGLMGVGS